MQHIVITAFNIFGRNDDDWLVPRMQMFKDLSLPSMLAQTDKNYTWLILIDVETPSSVVMELVSLIPPHAVIRTVKKESLNQKWKGPTKGAISTLAHPVNHMPRIMEGLLTDEWVVTVLCGVDDSLSTDFIETLKKETREHAETLVFTEGALKMDAGIAARDGYYRVHSDLFAVVVVEPAEGFQSVLAGGAHRTKDEKRRISTPEPMWLWHIHGIDQNCSPNSNFRFVPNRTPYTHEGVKSRFNYKGPATRFEQANANG